MNFFNIITKKISKPSMKEIIEEIHETFYTEVNRLLEQAEIRKSPKTEKGELLDKANNLRDLGFLNTKEVCEAKKEQERISKIKNENQNKQSLIEVIKYFSFKYPHYKFITEDSVKKICQKYNLIYSTVNRYIGTVPDKNLEEMTKFSISDEDKCYEHYEESRYGIRGHEFLSKEACLRDEKLNKEFESRHGQFPRLDYHMEIYQQCKLEIVAPLKDFDTKNMELKDFKLSKFEIPDPVVLQPVYYKGNKYYLIVTAWGDEASDELVVNQKMN